MTPARIILRTTLAAAAASFLGAVPALAGSEAGAARPALTLDLSAALAQPDPAAPDAARPDEAGGPDPIVTAAGSPRPRIGFGRAGSEWLTFGGAFAYDFAEDKDFNVHAAYSQFLADELEFAVEFAGWYFAQDKEDTGGISGSMAFRWHFLHDDAYDWTVYGDAGIGLLAAFDEVPNGGKEFNFLPRLGMGFTKRISEDGARLQVGVRWHHISNGRYAGDANNPSRDSVLIHAGIMIPF